MKKLIYIAFLLVTTVAIQSCCATANCPGVAQVETPQNNS
jgi:hypothetical protein